MFGVVLSRLFFELELEALLSFLISLVFFSRFCRTRFLPTERLLLFPFDELETTEGALLLLPTLLACLLPPEWEYNRFEISLTLAFFLACYSSV